MPSSPDLLLLWDIDGTLLASGGAGMRALRTALATHFGIDGSLDDIDFAGRTDPWIMRRIFAKFLLPDTEETMAAFAKAYFTALPAELTRSTSRVLPGVAERLAEASRDPRVAQGLLTGNRRRGAEIKLAHHGLWETFAFGAFADDHELRNELGPVALRRACDHHGVTFAPERTWVIGDTPHDIACGRAIGARTLAVATGHADSEALRAHGPDVLLSDLGDATRFWEAIGA
jgi:phosphoglycolate phosphatase-like HAD superfamily hydrolase